MIPGYAAIAILSLIAWRHDSPRRWVQASTTILALILAGLSVSLSLLLPMFRLPAPTGPYPVGTSILYFKDSTRIEDAVGAAGSPRELMVQLWYPAQSSNNRFARYRRSLETNILSSYQSVLPTNSRLDAPMAAVGAPFPVILFNHAWRGRRTNDTFLIEELASHGYVVASIDHTYNASLVELPGGRIVRGTASNDIDDPESSTPQHVRAIWDKELHKWVADQRFVLDRLDAINRASGTPWFGRLNTNTTGAIGHSFGGAAATSMCAEDPRVRAAVNMDGWFFGAIRERGPNQPLLVINASEQNAPPDANAKVATLLDTEDFADTEASLRRFGGDLLSIKGAAHDDFTDQPLVSPLRMLSHRGALPAQRIQEIVRTYVLAFFDQALRGEDPAVLRAHAGCYAEVSLEVWPADKNGIASPASADRRLKVEPHSSALLPRLFRGAPCGLPDCAMFSVRQPARSPKRQSRVSNPILETSVSMGEINAHNL